MSEGTIAAVAAQTTDPISLTTEVVSAYLSNNHVQSAEIPRLIGDVHAALASLGRSAQPTAPAIEKLTPAQVKKSVTPDALISFIDGKPYKTLKRHLTRHGLTIEQYRERYGLAKDYPSTAASYSQARSALARSSGLGQARRKAAQKAATADAKVTEAPKRRGRKKAA